MLLENLLNYLFKYLKKNIPKIVGLISIIFHLKLRIIFCPIPASSLYPQHFHQSSLRCRCCYFPVVDTYLRF